VTRSHLHLRAKPGKREELLRELDRLGVLAVVREHAGFLDGQVLLSYEDEDHVLVTSSWASSEHYERWQRSGARDRLARELEPLLGAEPRSELYHVVDAIG
jgi:heme-degrading monooxygenase HmoA